MTKITIDTAGLRAALDDLSGAEKREVSRDLRNEFNALAAAVITDARGLALTRQDRRAADTLAPASTALGAAVRFGRGFAGAFGAEFGAAQNSRRLGRPGGRVAYVKGWNQFRSWRGSGTDAGYFLWPAVRSATRDHVDKLAERVSEILSGR